MTGVLRITEPAVQDSDYSRHLAVLEDQWVGLPDKPEETAVSTLRALWLAAAGEPCSVELASRRPLPVLDADGRAALNRLVERRRAGVPLAHLTGRQSFMGLELLAGPEALIPRRETELLGEGALEVLRRTVAERGPAVVMDVCTGSGNLALALAHHEPQCSVIAGDLSDDAVELGRRNAEHTGLADRVRFIRGDLFAPFEAAGLRAAADLIVCNPPYISTAKVAGMPTEIAEFEPRLAFDGGAFGISILFRLVAGAPQFLKPGSWLCFEVGVGQGEPMAKRLERAGGYAIVERVRDGAGEIRALLARTRGAN
ncbi:MAG: peptide chain release factor N(5)-glutamine methyltransferase [Gemmatimonadota bacterium]|nr:peptide chain release factor N(5)-glutamine methyltransferase [Gemmatimonadota bacterium]